jgi:hypothetical protein
MGGYGSWLWIWVWATGSNTKCGKPSCCRATDGPGGVGSSAGMFGDYHCDDPVTTIDVLVDTLKKITPPPDFVIWTGKSPSYSKFLSICQSINQHSMCMYDQNR